MPITISVGGIMATYSGAAWQSSDANADAVLDTLNGMMAEPMGVTGADPYPALTKAKEIARRLRGTITDEGHAPETQPGRVY